MYRITRYTQPRSTGLFPGFVNRSPWAGIESEIDRLFESALADFGTPSAPRFPVDLYED
jgi:HSP20 family protein